MQKAQDLSAFLCFLSSVLFRRKRLALTKRYEVIKSLSDEYNVNALCEALKVAKGSYYNHISRTFHQK